MPQDCEPVLEFNTVYPLSEEPQSIRTGLGYFIMSHTFLKIYNDSINSGEIDPNTLLLIDTPMKNLIKILENRTFQEKTMGYMTTIQNAGEKSEEILSRRNWL